MSELSSGFGRMLVALYAVFAVAATARSAYQLLTRFDDAPVAYLLSAAAGAIYIVATIALMRNNRALALITMSIEMAGVAIVGLLTVLDEELFPDATVWSNFGQGYVFIPLVLPAVGLWWLRRSAR